MKEKRRVKDFQQFFIFKEGHLPDVRNYQKCCGRPEWTYNPHTNKLQISSYFLLFESSFQSFERKLQLLYTREHVCTILEEPFVIHIKTLHWVQLYGCVNSGAEMICHSICLDKDGPSEGYWGGQYTQKTQLLQQYLFSFTGSC